MAALPGHVKGGGRVKGTPNKLTQSLQEVAKTLGVDPFKLLLQFAANDWAGLGYEERTHKVLSKSGAEIEVDNIEPSERIVAAKAACEYLYPKRKAVELSGAEGRDFFDSLTQVFKRVADAKTSK